MDGYHDDWYTIYAAIVTDVPMISYNRLLASSTMQLHTFFTTLHFMVPTTFRITTWPNPSVTQEALTPPPRPMRPTYLTFGRHQYGGVE